MDMDGDDDTVRLDYDERVLRMASDVETVSGDSDASASFDISLPATHSYMGDMQRVGPGEVVRAGWRGALPALAASCLAFIGETVPLRLPAADAALVDGTDHLFVLVFPDDMSMMASPDGVLCETFERSEGEVAGEGEEEEAAVTLKARVTHRVRVRHDHPVATHGAFKRPRKVQVEVLGELLCVDPLQHIRLSCGRGVRRGAGAAARRAVDRMDAALTPWPSALYRMIDCHRLQNEIKDHFKRIDASGDLRTMMPSDPLALSLWGARHAAHGPRARRRLWDSSGTVERLWKTCELLERQRARPMDGSSSLCCAACGTDVSSFSAMVAMSSEGAHSQYTNPGGHTHDILTVRDVSNVRVSGPPSAEYSWFPGYMWNAMKCVRCYTHLGWRFHATSPTLWPRVFYGVCRAMVGSRDELQPHDPYTDSDSDEEDYSHLLVE